MSKKAKGYVILSGLSAAVIGVLTLLGTLLGNLLYTTTSSISTVKGSDKAINNENSPFSRKTKNSYAVASNQTQVDSNIVGYTSSGCSCPFCCAKTQ